MAEEARQVDPAPPGSIDCQIHVFGDPKKYPVDPNLRYEAPEAPIDAAERLHRNLGFSRAVITQTTAYGADHRLLIDLIARAPAKYRGIALIDDSVSDREIARLHDAGVRGTRFNLIKAFDGNPTPRDMKRTLDRIRDFGWVARFHVDSAAIRELREFLTSVKDPAVIDHLGRPDFTQSVDQPATRFALDLLRGQPNWWILLSFGQASGQEPWDPSVPFGKAFYAAAPDRALWASDWPHIGYITSRPPKQPPSDAAGLNLLYRYLPDQEARRKVLVENPARLFGFT
jgi:2-pyrone-4,6-dicarboxylate lactonase